MKCIIDGLEILFPYDYMYPEQYNYMLELKRALDAKGHALLEMPTGTGKTVCLLSLVLAYQAAHPEIGKLIYCTRTVPEMVKCMEEIKRLVQYRVTNIGLSASKVLGICLSSRRNLCIHSRVMEDNDRDSVDTMCRNMTASWVRNKATEATELCSFYEAFDTHGNVADLPYGIYSLEELKAFGKEKNWCPYFLARRVLNHANIIVYNYQYMLDPKISNLISQEIESQSIVVFDEAHNIDTVCIEALSVTLDKRSMDISMNSVTKLQHKINEIKVSDTQRLVSEYQALVQGLQQQGAVTDNILANPLLPEDIMQEAVPGNIRKAEHFIVFLKKLVEYLRTRMKSTNVEEESPTAFVHDLITKTALDRKALKFTYSRLNSLLRTLEITSLDDFGILSNIANFITLISTYMEGFSVIFEPLGSIISGIQEPLLQLCCVDSSLAIKPVFQKFHSVIITSGTLSPIDLYPKLLNFQPVIRATLPMSTFRSCLLPLVITRGSDQIPLSTRFEQRKDVSVVRNYGHLLLEIASHVPDGVCCFFTSYQYMEQVVSQWDEMRILQQILQHKLIYFETKDVVETTLALDNYKRACDCGRGAIFFSIARGKVAEGIDFDRHYGRCVLLFGIPYQYTLSRVLRSRLEFIRMKYQIKDNDYLTFDALRQASQCVGRVIRSKTDYGIVILADSRFNRYDKRSKLPPWINQFMKDQCLNLSTDAAIEQVKTFLRHMGQPIDQEALHSILMTEEQVQRIKSGVQSNSNRMGGVDNGESMDVVT